MGAKCVYDKFMYERCMNDKKVCHIQRRKLQHCLAVNRGYYKHPYIQINDTRKSRVVSHKD